MNDDRPLSAMVSYQTADRDAAELLHEALALRGFVVVHDQCTFASGSRIATEMELGVQTCDAFLTYSDAGVTVFGCGTWLTAAGT